MCGLKPTDGYSEPTDIVNSGPDPEGFPIITVSSVLDYNPRMPFFVEFFDHKPSDPEKDSGSDGSLGPFWGSTGLLGLKQC